jgi:hypothetical protein
MHIIVGCKISPISILSFVVILTSSKFGYVPISNLLWLNSSEDQIKSIISNSKLCWSWWYDTPKSIVSKNCRYYKNYCGLWYVKFTSSVFQIGAVWFPRNFVSDLCCWDKCWGVKKWPNESTCGSPHCSYSIGVCWRGIFILIGYWDSMLGTS